MALNWAYDQPWDFYNRLLTTGDPVLTALDSALDIIETTPGSAAARPRTITSPLSPPPVWLVDVRHPSGDLQILWQEDGRGDPVPLWIGDARFP